MSESSRPSKEPPVELDVPEGIEEAEQSVELVRAWIADGALMVSLNADAFGERVSDWGRLLSEITEHVAKATALQGYMSEAEAEAAIRQTYTASGLVQGSQSRTRSAEGRILRTKH
ncbi:MAG TPA: DUF5076 domain-containing protein [Hyphomicrobium sp.]|nr:DUF5076 domain-containing protein [Hyphomicrobium sp.]